MAKKENIKTRQFDVPKDFIGTFFSELEESGLSYEVIEYDTDSEELITEIEYSPEQRDAVMDLIESIEEYFEEQGESEEESDN